MSHDGYTTDITTTIIHKSRTIWCFRYLLLYFYCLSSVKQKKQIFIFSQKKTKLDVKKGKIRCNYTIFHFYDLPNSL